MLLPLFKQMSELKERERVRETIIHRIDILIFYVNNQNYYVFFYVIKWLQS